MPHIQKLQTLKVEALLELQSLQYILGTDFRSTETHIYCYDYLHIDLQIGGHSLLEKEPVLMNNYRKRPVFTVNLVDPMTDAQQKLCETF